MRRYRVGFDGRRQERFEDLDDALEWGRAVAETGRLVFVWRGWLWTKLIAVFPEDQKEEGRRLWKRARTGIGTGDWAAGLPPGGF